MHLGLKNHTNCAFFHGTWKSENRGQKSLRHLCNSANYLCLNNWSLKKGLLSCQLKTGYFSPPLLYNVESEETAGNSFQHGMGVRARFGRRGCIRVWRVRKNARSANLSLVHDCRILALQVAVAVVSTQSSIRKLIDFIVVYRTFDWLDLKIGLLI